MKHSPGPWEVDERFLAASPKQSNFRIFAANQVCELTTPSGFYRSPAETEANARLIEAAPDLLAALEGLFEHCVMIHKHWGEGSNQREADAAQNAARAAIAKAVTP